MTEIDTVQVGGRIFTNVSDLVILQTVCDPGMGGFHQWGTFRAGNAAGGYQVPHAHIFRALALQIIRGSGTTSLIPTNTDLLYGDNDVGFNSVLAPVTPVYYCTAAGGYAGCASLYSPAGITVDGDIFERAIKWDIPQDKYPAFQGNVSLREILIVLYGYVI